MDDWNDCQIVVRVDCEGNTHVRITTWDQGGHVVYLTDETYQIDPQMQN